MSHPDTLHSHSGSFSMERQDISNQEEFRKKVGEVSVSLAFY